MSRDGFIASFILNSIYGKYPVYQSRGGGKTLMTEKERIIKCLKLMGYKVLDNPIHSYIQVCVQCDNGFGVFRTVWYSDLNKEQLIPSIVRDINERLIEEIEQHN